MVRDFLKSFEMKHSLAVLEAEWEGAAQKEIPQISKLVVNIGIQNLLNSQKNLQTREK